MLDGEISKYVDVLQGVAQGCTLSLNLFRTNIHDLIIAVDATKQGITVGEDVNTRRIAETNREGARIY